MVGDAVLQMKIESSSQPGLVDNVRLRSGRTEECARFKADHHLQHVYQPSHGVSDKRCAVAAANVSSTGRALTLDDGTPLRIKLRIGSGRDALFVIGSGRQ